MSPTTKKILKWTGIVFGGLLVFVVAFGAYVYSIVPKPIGSPIVLQKELFAKPPQDLPMAGKYIYKSATELAVMIRRREAASTEIVSEYLANIKNNNYKYNALIWLREQEALAEAKLADEAVARGDTAEPLLGVPVTIKEMFWVKGSPSTLNAKMFGFIAPRDGVVVQQIKNAGAIILGTTNVPFMLSDYQTQGEVYPTGNNPYDTTRTPGGSTGGGAAALAAGFTALELGSDLGGSIRVPAAFCGLWGLKPTVGAVNTTQGATPDTVTKFSRFALASPGPLARTPEDLELMWNVIRDTKIDERFQRRIDWQPASNKTLGQYKIAWMEDWPREGESVKVSGEVKERLNALLAALQQHGATAEKIAPDIIYDDLVKMFLASFGYMMGEGQPWLLRKFMQMGMQNMSDGSPNFAAFDASIMDASDAGWNKVQTDRKALIEKWEAFFKQHDFFICPITYGAAFKKCATGSLIPASEGQTVKYMAYVPYSYIINATGHPAVIIPTGLNAQGLPLALQIVGANYSEAELLHFAKLLQPLTPGFVKPQGL